MSCISPGVIFSTKRCEPLPSSRNIHNSTPTFQVNIFSKWLNSTSLHFSDLNWRILFVSFFHWTCIVDSRVQGFTLNEYSLRPILDGKPQEPLPVSSERDVFDYLGYPFKEPQERNWTLAHVRRSSNVAPIMKDLLIISDTRCLPAVAAAPPGPRPLTRSQQRRDHLLPCPPPKSQGDLNTLLPTYLPTSSLTEEGNTLWDNDNIKSRYWILDTEPPEYRGCASKQI